MPVLYTHLIPATFGGRARMNVANALAAAAAAWSAGAHLHDIRQGLRTFTTSFFQAPGRLNLLEVGGVRVVIDYCHNVDGMRALADFVTRMMEEPEGGAGRRRGAPALTRTGRAIGVLGIPGDRRDDDQRLYGAVAVTRSTRSSSARTSTPGVASRARARRTSWRGRGRPAPRAPGWPGRRPYSPWLYFFRRPVTPDTLLMLTTNYMVVIQEDLKVKVGWIVSYLPRNGIFMINSQDDGMWTEFTVQLHGQDQVTSCKWLRAQKPVEEWRSRWLAHGGQWQGFTDQ